MTEGPRINPRRPTTPTQGGVKRIALASRKTAADNTANKPLRIDAQPESWIFAVAYSDRGTLDQAAREALAAAAILADKKTGVLAVIFGALTETLGHAGADQVAIFEQLDSSHFNPDATLSVLETLIAHYTPRHIILPDDQNGTGDLGRRLIAKTGLSGATCIAEIGHDHVAIEQAGSVGRLQRAPIQNILLLKSGAVGLDLPFCGNGERLSIKTAPGDKPHSGAYRDLGVDIPPASALALDEADLVVSAGHGVKNPTTLQKLAENIGAAVGASRVAVDEGKYPRDRQVGATGKTVTARGYIAVGISGAVQHLQGIATCRHVVAINKDAGAPIVKRADLTIVGDAEDVMQALITRIDQARKQREIPGAE